LLKVPMPRYLHTPLVLADDGQKLSKQNGAQALDLGDPLITLKAAGGRLGLPDDLPGATLPDWLAAAVACWPSRP
ncbi:MAG: tRNA glutamyl-Q(34) synthetase GluQRS, partial [Rubrivivax sp.]